MMVDGRKLKNEKYRISGKKNDKYSDLEEWVNGVASSGILLYFYKYIIYKKNNAVSYLRFNLYGSWLTNVCWSWCKLEYEICGTWWILNKGWRWDHRNQFENDVHWNQGNTKYPKSG